jgi:hypothetical protein
VNILQNISQSRSDKKIKLSDLKIAAISCFLPLYPGKTMFCTSLSPTKKPYGHNPVWFIHCVKGRGDGKADVLWQVLFSSQENLSPNEMPHFGVRKAHANSVVKYYSNTAASSIYKDLTINSGEIKILIECSSIYFYGNKNYSFSDGRPFTKVTPREAFDFLVLSPKHKTVYGKAVSTGTTYFNSVVIFTPKPGLFSETAPQ